MNEEARIKIVKARIALISEQPFYGALALRLLMVEDNTIPTLAVNGKQIKYNAEFILSLSHSLVKSAVAHEVGHCVFEHIARRGDRNPQKWNCVDEASAIAMADGTHKPAGEIKVGDMVATPFGPTAILALRSNLDRDIVELGLHDGTSLVCTADHKILTQKGYKNAVDIDPAYDTCFVDTRNGCTTSQALRNDATQRNSCIDAAPCDASLFTHGADRGRQGSQNSEAGQSEKLSELVGCGSSVFCGDRGWRRDHNYPKVSRDGAHVHTTISDGEQYLACVDAVVGGTRHVRNHQNEFVGQSVLVANDFWDSDCRLDQEDPALFDYQTGAFQIDIGNYLSALETRTSRPADTAHAELVQEIVGFERTRFTFARRLEETRNVFDFTTTHQCFIAQGIVVHNCAGDYVINHILKESGFEIGEGWLINPAFADMSSDHVYSLLPDPPEGPGTGPGVGAPGGALCDIEDADTKDDASSVDEWKIAAVQAATAARQAGKLPATLERFIDDLINPKADWRSLLRRFVTEINKADYSWARPNKRFIHAGFYLPTLHSEGMGEIVIAVDTSGSITQQMLNTFQAEIQCIRDTVRPRMTRIIYCDSAVNHVDEFAAEDLLEMKMHGGGGTAFEPVAEYLIENGCRPSCVLYLTDGYGSFDFKPNDDTPWMWVMTTNVVAPWGETVEISD